MDETVTQLDRAMVMDDFLSEILDNVNSKIEKEDFVDIDTNIVPIQMMTDELLAPKSAEQMRFELEQLIKEAKSKIKPVLMSKYDQAKYIRPMDEVGKTEGMIVIDQDGHIILDKNNITLEILRKIEDKRFEVDLHYEKTRDLYEKQRVVDQFLEEHQEDYEVLHAYY